ncbi:Epsin-3, clathrin recruitment and traffic between the Golgi and endosome [Coemansia sp. RSA 1722]|nr:Epsin-3, clathrin recruitment and traffic between the Golgi and endosome [Coemansia sp. RSA 486]KAJ2598839.1 Epsin-3, clathrin recruitment and traffic between the Golgi and endosome [Coemansia sp. RSA 1722]
MDKLSEISKWDVLNVYNKVKNVVMNYTEYEIKVHEATGPEPWGASSTLMREISNATFDRRHCDEIMAAIYMRFNDTDPSNWRQVYKGLQLLEFLVKNGSEKVVDEIRSHITIVKMLKNFHHIDANGKDQGINVRQRSKELVDLIQNNERLREERKKSKDNSGKYGGFSGGTRTTGFGSTSSGGRGRYGGFGSDSVGRSGNGRYSGFGSDGYTPSAPRLDDRSDSGSSYYRSETDDRRTPTPATSSNSASGRNSRPKSPSVAKPAPAEPAVVDLFSFDDDDFSSTSINNNQSILNPASSTSKPNASMSASFTLPAPTSAHTTKAAVSASKPANANAFDDDWGDFQGGSPTTSAPPKSAVAQPPATTAANSSNSATAAGSGAMMDLLGGGDLNFGFQPLPVSPSNAANVSTNTMNGAAFSSANGFKQPLSPSSTASAKPGDKSSQKKSAAAFNDIWDMSSDLLSLDSLSISKKGNNSNMQNKNASSQVSMNNLASQQNHLL